jgi:DNA-binding transcriptional LysR family regulator
MKLEQFLYIIKIVECKSISAAARQLYISQPALSSSISSMEKELQFQIFERVPGGISLTEKGSELYQISKRICAELDEVGKLSSASSHTKRIRIAAVPMACASMMLDLVESCKKAMPDVVLNISELRPVQIMKMLSEGEVSVAVTSCVPGYRKKLYEESKDLHLEIESLMEDRMIVYLAASNPLSGKKYISIEELKNEHAICFQDIAQRSRGNTEQEEEKGHIYCFTGRTSIKDAVARDMGYALLPSMMTIGDIYIESGKTKAIPLKERVPVSLELICHKEDMLAEEEKHLLQILRDSGRKYRRKLSSLYPGHISGETGDAEELYY